MDHAFLTQWCNAQSDDSRVSILSDALASGISAKELAQLQPRFDQTISALSGDSTLLDKIQTIRKQSEVTLSETLKPRDGFRVNQHWSQFSIVDERDQSQELEQLLDNPDAFIDQGRIIKSGKATTVAIVQSGSKPFFIKRYNRKSTLYNVLRSVIPSRAAVTWHAAQLLESIGVPTARPIALLEKRVGPVKLESYVIHEYVESIHALAFFGEGANPEPEWQPAAKAINDILYSLKRSLIIHGDLKGQNFIMHNGKPLLIDLDSLKSYRSISHFNKQYPKDLQRFERNWLDEPEARPLFQPAIDQLRENS